MTTTTQSRRMFSGDVDRLQDWNTLLESELAVARRLAYEYYLDRVVSTHPEDMIVVTVRSAGTGGQICYTLKVPISLPLSWLKQVVAYNIQRHAFEFHMVYAGKVIGDNEARVSSLCIDVGTDDTIYIRPNFNLGKS